MSFPVDNTVTVDGVTIKCSKTFDQLGTITAEELREYAVAGIYEIGVGRAGISAESFGSDYHTVEANAPIEYINSEWSDVRVKYNIDYNPLKNCPHYGFTILTYGLEWQNIRSTTDNARLVLDVPIQDIYVDIGALTANTINKYNDADDSELDTITYYTTNDLGVVKTVNNNVNTNLHLMDVFVYDDTNFFIFPSSYKGGAPLFKTTYGWHGNTDNARGGMSGTTAVTPYYATTYFSQTGRYVNMCNDEALSGKTFDNVNWAQAFTLIFDTPDQEKEQSNSYVVLNYTGAGPPDFDGSVTFYPKGGERIAMLGFANSSIKFKYDGTMYKPIIAQGVVIDYTDDMSAESEFDDITSVTGNKVPSGPPTPPKPAPGHWDSIESSGTYSGALRFVRAYYMSGTELSNLKTYMGKTEAQGGPPDGYDLLESIIAIKMYPFALATTASDSITISLTNPGGTWTELMRNNFIAQVASAITGQPYPGTEPPQVRIINTGCNGFATDASMRNYDLGSLDMSKFVNDKYPFLTYDATVELYIPFVGTFVLDAQTVMGRTLHCYLNLDPATGGVYGYCYCNNKGTNVMIASGTGNIGIDVPISSAQAGIVQAQTDNIRHQQAAGLITTAAAMALPVIGASAAAGAAAYTEGQILRGIASASEVSRASSAAYRSTFAKELGSKGIAGEAVATTTNALTANRQVKNLVQSHNMAMTGSIGQSVAEWSCPHKAYVKIMRPQVHNPGNNYEHSVAVPAYTSGKLSSYKGLTVCVNPDVSGVTKATPAERNAIVAMLQGGVIV